MSPVTDIDKHVKMARAQYAAVDRAKAKVEIVRWECLPCGSRQQSETKDVARAVTCSVCGHVTNV
jgi:transcription elongation factor Elf1